jgi:hypothetical protein
MTDAPILLFGVREKQRRAIGSCVLLVAMSVFVVTIDDRGWLVRIVGVLGVVLFGTATALHLRRMSNSERPYVIISDDGFTDNGPLGVGFVSWLEVTDLQWRRQRKANWVTGRVRDPARLDRERSPLAKVLARLERRGDFWISDQLLSISAEEMLHLMIERWRRALAR